MDWLEQNLDAYRIIAEILEDLRETVRLRLDQVHGQKWYETSLPDGLLDRLVVRKEEEKAIDWYESEYQQIMSYALFPDLLEILEHNAESFRQIMGLAPTGALLNARFSELEVMRAKLGRARPISETELSFLGTFHLRFRKAIEDHRDRMEAGDEAAPAAAPRTAPAQPAPEPAPAPSRPIPPPVEPVKPPDPLPEPPAQPDPAPDESPTETTDDEPTAEHPPAVKESTPRPAEAPAEEPPDKGEAETEEPPLVHLCIEQTADLVGLDTIGGEVVNMAEVIPPLVDRVTELRAALELAQDRCRLLLRRGQILAERVDVALDGDHFAQLSV